MTTMSNSSSHEDAASISGVARTSRDALNEAVEDIKQNLGENSDEGYRQFLELLLQERDSVSFGKRASIMDFVKAGAIYSEETGQTPSRSRPLVKEVLGGIMTKLPDQDRVRWIHLPANNMFWVEVSTAARPLQSPIDANAGSYESDLRERPQWRHG
jgi:hypothetical protein